MQDVQQDQRTAATIKAVQAMNEAIERRMSMR
jgi:hypothetical protein